MQSEKLNDETLWTDRMAGRERRRRSLTPATVFLPSSALSWKCNTTSEYPRPAAPPSWEQYPSQVTSQPEGRLQTIYL